MSTLSERLSEAIKRKEQQEGRKLLVQEIAGGFGMSRQALNAVMSGRTENPQLKHLVSGAKWLDVSTDWLAVGDLPMERKPYSGGGVDFEALESSIDVVISNLRQARLSYSSRFVSELVILVYELALEIGKPPKRETVLRLIRTKPKSGPGHGGENESGDQPI